MDYKLYSCRPLSNKHDVRFFKEHTDRVSRVSAGTTREEVKRVGLFAACCCVLVSVCCAAEVLGYSDLIFVFVLTLRRTPLSAKRLLGIPLDSFGA